MRRVHDAVGGRGGRGVVSWGKKDFVRSFTLTLSELGSSGHKSGIILLKFQKKKNPSGCYVEGRF